MKYKMKKGLSVLALLVCANSVFSQTLFSFGNTNVDKEEFLKAYNKNKVTAVNKEASLREYLDLYAKFKLKVKAAKELGLDTLPQLQYDLQSFRTQVEDTYMNDEKIVDEMVDEAFTRSQKDIHVYHFFVPIAATTSATDTLKAYDALKEVANQLKQGNTNFDNIATDVSAKIYKIKNGDIGFVTAFTLPYEYENVIYKLAPGQASAIYRSKKGIHIFKNIEERNSIGKWRIAQILFAFAPGENATNTPVLKEKADAIFALIKKGGNFADLAKKNSDDKMTYAAGGELPEFSTGKFQPQFENELLKLKNNEDVSAVFATSFGYHIVKRLEQTPTPNTKENTNFLLELKQKVQQDARVNIAKEKFAQAILTKLNYKKINEAKEADLFKYADSVAKNPTSKTIFPVSNKKLFVLGKTTFTGANWLTFIKEYKNNGELYQGENNAALYTKFIYTAALDYYRKNLETYNTDFKYQMTEFKEGNMLFEIMEKNVWGKAANDSAGLQKHYQANKNKYKWAASAAVILFNCTNEAIAKKAIADITAGKDWKKITEEANNTIQADSGRYELTQIPVKEGTNLTQGLVTNAVVNALDGTASFVKILQLFNADQQRNYDEAKGLIINDYQTIVEEKWINDLKKKYPIKINEDVFKTLLK